MVKPEEMAVPDRWAVGCAKAAQEDILKAYEAYDFHEVVQRLMRFCSVEMGSLTSTSSKTVSHRQSGQRGASQLPDCAVSHRRSAGALDGPMLSFTADEVWATCLANVKNTSLPVSGTKACLVWQTVKR
ncbi:class I tRNA ligase family protein [Shigella flexneri]